MTLIDSFQQQIEHFFDNTHQLIKSIFSQIDAAESRDLNSASKLCHDTSLIMRVGGMSAICLSRITENHDDIVTAIGGGLFCLLCAQELSKISENLFRLSKQPSILRQAQTALARINNNDTSGTLARIRLVTDGTLLAGAAISTLYEMTGYTDRHQRRIID